MQRKISNIKYKLHSIPILLNMKNKSNVLYSIPCSCILALLLVGISCMVNLIMGNDSCYAITSASLSVSNNKLATNTVQGSVAYVSSNVTVSASEIESYALSITGPTNLGGEGSNGSSSGGSGGGGGSSSTIITGAGGRTPDMMSDNTWGYSWSDTNSNDSSLVYSSLSSTGTNLSDLPAVSNYSVDFTKKLTFAAKFGSDATGGHYTADVSLRLVATPRTVGIWSTGTNSGITTMQEMTPAVCDQVSTPVASSTAGATNAPTLVLSDSRDGNTYTIAKYPDGKCWMVDNLNLRLSTTKALTSDDSDVSSWTPTENTIVGKDNLTSNDFSSGFDYNNKPQSYINATDADIAYYNWYAATAGTGNSSVAAQYNEAKSSICPKGWKLPTGYNSESGTNDFYNLFSKMNLGATISPTGYTSWNDTQRLIAQNYPYNFIYTGQAYSGDFYDPSNGGAEYGFWWSRTASSNTNAYDLYINNERVYPGTRSINRYIGHPVRCIAAEPVQYQVTYSRGTSAGTQPDSFIEQFNSTYPAQTSPSDYAGLSYSFTTHAASIKYEFSAGMRTCTREVDGWSLTDGGDIVYSLGSTVALSTENPKLTLYAHYKLGGQSGCVPA